MRVDTSRWIAIACGTAVACAAAVAIARRAGAMYPVSDIALIELSTIKAAHGRLLLGAYSRFQWRHPGPLYFYLLAPFYLASGARTAGLCGGVLMINLLALAVTVWLLARRGGAAMALAFAALGTIYLARVTDILVSPWNAHAAVLPTLAATVAAAAVAAGDGALLPLFVLLASFAVQTHLAVLPAIAAAALVVAWSAVRTRPTIVARGWRAALWVAAIVWLLPLAEQVSRADGNLSRLWHFVLAAHPSHRLSAAAAAWADMSIGLFRRDLVLPRGVPLDPPTDAWMRAVAAVEVPALAATAWWARRSGRAFHAALAGAGAIGSLLALWSVIRVPDEILDHEVFWMSAVGLLNATVLAACAIDVIRGRRFAVAVAAAFLAAWTLVGFRALGGVTDRSHVVTNDDETVRDGTADIRNGLARVGADKPFIKIDQYVWGSAAGMVLQLRKAGTPLALEDDWGWMFDESLTARGNEDAEISICGGPVHDLNARRPGNINLVLNDHIAIDLLKMAPRASSTR